MTLYKICHEVKFGGLKMDSWILLDSFDSFHQIFPPFIGVLPRKDGAKLNEAENINHVS